MKIVCIGNSNVNGYPHRRSECWVSLLRDLTGIKTINKGINGDTVTGISERFEKDVITHKPEKAIILTGTNDFMQGRSVKDIMKVFKNMIERANNHQITPVILTPLLTDPSTASEEWIAEVDYNKVNEQLKELRKELLRLGSSDNDVGKAHIIDLQEEYDRGYTDGVHADKEGHERIAKIIAEQL